MRQSVRDFITPDGTASADAKEILRRALVNMGLLFSSKGAGALMQLGTFALIARGLGPAGFGMFTLLHTHVQLLSGITSLQSNQAIVHYGVRHMADDNAAGFQSLVKAGTLVDLGAALTAGILAFFLAPVVAPFLQWDPQLVFYAQCLSPLALANAIATPKGMLRLFGEFGLLARHAVVTPALRLTGSAIAFALDAPIAAYVGVWLAAGIAGAGVALWLGWRQAARRGLLSGWRFERQAFSRLNPGLWGFFALSNLQSTLALIPNHLAVFLVGGIAGPTAAGLFKVAREVATALGKPVDLLNQTLYPDLARLAHRRRWRHLLHMLARCALLAGGCGLAVLLAVWQMGGPVVALLFGTAFAEAAPVMSLLVAAMAITVLASAVEPTLYALGRPGLLLKVSLAGNAVFLVLLPLLLGAYGLIGSGYAALGAALLTTILLLAAAVAAVNRAERRAL